MLSQMFSCVSCTALCRAVSSNCVLGSRRLLNMGSLSSLSCTPCHFLIVLGHFDFIPNMRSFMECKKTESPPGIFVLFRSQKEEVKLTQMLFIFGGVAVRVNRHYLNADKLQMVWLHIG